MSVFKILLRVAVLLDLVLALFCLWGGIYGSLFHRYLWKNLTGEVRVPCLCHKGFLFLTKPP